MAPPPPHATLLLLRLAALAPLLLLAPACSAAPVVFQVRRRFPADRGGGGGVAALRSHDGCHHGRLLAAADLPLAGLSLPTDTEYAILHGDQAWDAAIGTGQLLDVVHWICQVVGLICGLLWGAVPLVGAVWIALFMAISTGIIYWYYAYVLKVDEEEYGGHGALLQEGLFASFTLFLLSWTLVYSLAHF